MRWIMYKIYKIAWNFTLCRREIKPIPGKILYTTEPLFTKRTDVLSPNLVKSRSREIGCYNDLIALKLISTSAALLSRFLRNFRAIGKVLTRISRLRDFTKSCGKASVRLVNTGPSMSRPKPGSHVTNCLCYLSAHVTMNYGFSGSL